MGNAPTKSENPLHGGKHGGGVGREGTSTYQPGTYTNQHPQNQHQHHPNHHPNHAHQQHQASHSSPQSAHHYGAYPPPMGIPAGNQTDQSKDMNMDTSHSTPMNTSPSNAAANNQNIPMGMNTDSVGGSMQVQVQPLSPNSTELMSLDDDTVPTVFRWEHGGRQVYITGTFNGWSRQIPMHRSGNDFTYIHNLKRGKHAFKFIVDDEWRFAPDQPTVADIEGRINNFIDVSDFQAYTGDRHFEERTESYSNIKAAASKSNSNNNQTTTTNHEGMQASDGKQNSSAVTNMDTHSTVMKDREGFSNTMPDLDEYTKEPPPLPPHLRHIILNKPPQLSDTAALPVPQHVALNHLYCTAIKDNMMVLGITQRYKTKFVTTVYYSPCTG